MDTHPPVMTHQYEPISRALESELREAGFHCIDGKALSMSDFVDELFALCPDCAGIKLSGAKNPDSWSARISWPDRWLEMVDGSALNTVGKLWLMLKRGARRH